MFGRVCVFKLILAGLLLAGNARAVTKDLGDSPYKVIVEVWDKGAQLPDGLGGFNQAPDTLAKTVELNYPTAMTDSSVYLTSTRYIVVKEAATV